MAEAAPDTLAFVRELEEAGFSRAQAEAIAGGQRMAANQLATKTDLQLAISQLETRLIRWLLVVVGLAVAVIKLVPDFGVL